MSLALIVRSLDRSSFEPLLASIYPTPWMRQQADALGVELIEAPEAGDFPHTTGSRLRLWNPRHQIRLLRASLGYRRHVQAAENVIRDARPDLVHLNSATLAPFADATHRAGVPFVWHIREVVLGGLRGRWLADKIRTLPDVAIYISEDERSRWGDAPNSVVVPNWMPVDTSVPSRPEARSQIAVDDDAQVVLFLGGLAKIKGAEVIADAMLFVTRALPRSQLLVVGVTPPSASWKSKLARSVFPRIGLPMADQRARAAFARLGDRARLLPFQEDLAAYLAGADVLVFPSTEPHFARPVVEAAVHGLPVVASDLEGTRELIEHGATGLLVPPNDSQALGDAIVGILDDPARARAMAAEAKRRALERFDPDRCMGEIIAIYQRLLNGDRT